MHHGFSVSSPDGYRDPIRLLIRCCRPGPVHLNGPMGAGKTTFTAMFFKELGVQDAVSSPTFSLIQEYLGKEGRRLVHMDLYRLKNEQEAFAIGLEDYLYSGDWCLIEWADRIPARLDEWSCRIDWSLKGKQRELTMEIP
jgi:tRNA threonylcarbamoyladenosine biosynthesis protein TsaE